MYLIFLPLSLKSRKQEECSNILCKGKILEHPGGRGKEDLVTGNFVLHLYELQTRLRQAQTFLVSVCLDDLCCLLIVLFQLHLLFRLSLPQGRLKD